MIHGIVFDNELNIEPTWPVVQVFADLQEANPKLQLAWSQALKQSQFSAPVEFPNSPPNEHTKGGLCASNMKYYGPDGKLPFGVPMCRENQNHTDFKDWNWQPDPPPNFHNSGKPILANTNTNTVWTANLGQAYTQNGMLNGNRNSPMSQENINLFEYNAQNNHVSKLNLNSSQQNMLLTNQTTALYETGWEDAFTPPWNTTGGKIVDTFWTTLQTHYYNNVPQTTKQQNLATTMFCGSGDCQQLFKDSNTIFDIILVYILF